MGKRLFLHVVATAEILVQESVSALCDSKGVFLITRAGWELIYARFLLDRILELKKNF